MSEEKEIYEIERDTALILSLNEEAEKLMAEGQKEKALEKLRQIDDEMKKMIRLEEYVRGKIIKEEEKDISITKHLAGYLEELEQKIKAARQIINKRV